MNWGIEDEFYQRIEAKEHKGAFKCSWGWKKEYSLINESNHAEKGWD